jgi:type I restriction enzyme S subunit
MNAQHWQTRRLGELCSKIGSGVTPRGGDSVYTTDSTALIRSQNIYNSDFATQGLAFIDDKQAERMSGVRVAEDDVLLNITGDSVARCCRVPANVLPARVNQHVSIIRTDANQLSPDFLMYYLTSPHMQAIMLSLAGSGGTRKALTKRMIEDFRVPFPDFPTQERVVHLLKCYDDLIANNNNRIELLERSAQLLFEEWFVRLRYPRHEHDKIVDGLPEGWSRKTLGDVAQTNAESFSKKNLPNEITYIDIASVKEGCILTKTRLMSEEAPGRARRKAKDGDVIWSNVRPNLRQFALVLDPDDLDVFSTGFTILTPTSVPYSFLYVAVTTDAFVAHLVNQTTGSSYPAVRPDDFERAEILVPPNPLLDEFQIYCEPLFRLSHKLGKENEKLARARDLLLPRLMDGRIEV